MGRHELFKDHVTTADADHKYTVLNLGKDLSCSEPVSAITNLSQWHWAVGQIVIVCEHLVDDVDRLLEKLCRNFDRFLRYSFFQRFNEIVLFLDPFSNMLDAPDIEFDGLGQQVSLSLNLLLVIFELVEIIVQLIDLAIEIHDLCVFGGEISIIGCLLLSDLIELINHSFQVLYSILKLFTDHLELLFYLLLEHIDIVDLSFNFLFHHRVLFILNCLEQLLPLLEKIGLLLVKSQHVL